MRRTWFIIDKRSNEIINAVECDGKEQAEAVAFLMIDGEHLYVNDNPPIAMLRRYRYWDERP